MKSGGFVIRAAMAADLPDLLRLYRHLQPEDAVLAPGLARQRFETILAHPGMTVLVSLSRGEAVATITLVVIPNLTRGGAPYALIENVVTDSAHRKRGHAGALIRQAFRTAWDDGCYKVMLLSGSKDPETLDFYRHCGFIQDKTGFQIRRPAAA
ncbi:L-amino acid N-acyltransferase YncA [Hoeflea marina]|uniref:L-amino acid N-acyltransferase YncA n=1 Tax=Hoeflea marina TaxID=274592 RepID=A0A317PEP5_9HYPH|nr:GNAT family N-acetyltransferase [Hoeflea marina]PWV97596.1 L-amino acid N-acyltransferase YncA [Hoeflea marina]